ncbi:HAD family hydrolase [Salinirussus salinus]|uniref:HAD family hydrolase n=1 Tax=Salinirussus salinus TaxID=1198300 RepID=UPI001358C9D3|nr:HAD family hydrolase [Salinirussus salinus]
MTDAPVEAVLFDIDGTLVEYERTPGDLLPLAFEAAGVDPFFDAADYEARYGEFAEESEDVQDLRKRCFADIAREEGRDPEVGRAVARAYAAERDHTRVDPLPGAHRALNALDSRYSLAAVTNGGPGMQGRKLAAVGLDDRFETVVHAGYETAAKPAVEPFQAALESLGVAPERSVYVGNSLEADVAGANRAGVRSVWFDRDGVADPEPEPHGRVSSLHALVDEPW